MISTDAAREAEIRTAIERYPNALWSAGDFPFAVVRMLLRRLDEARAEITEINAYYCNVETQAFIRGREAGLKLAALEDKYGSFDAKVQAQIRDGVAAELEATAKEPK